MEISKPNSVWVSLVRMRNLFKSSPGDVLARWLIADEETKLKLPKTGNYRKHQEFKTGNKGTANSHFFLV